MNVTDWKLVQTAATADKNGDNDRVWYNPNNILTETDETSASSTTGKSGYSTEYLIATNFGFTNADIPEGATIDGIEVLVRRNASGNNYAYDNDVFLYNNGIIGSNQSSAAYWSALIESKIFGGALNLWGTPLTQAIITNLNFGFIMTGMLGVDGASVSVYYIKMRVHYTAGGGDKIISMGFMNETPVYIPVSNVKRLTESGWQ